MNFINNKKTESNIVSLLHFSKTGVDREEKLQHSISPPIRNLWNHIGGRNKSQRRERTRSGDITKVLAASIIQSHHLVPEKMLKI